MWTLGPLGFTAPWLLLGLAALPVLWLILRAVPPAPIRRRFPGVALLLGLKDDEAQTERTPWWLLLLRMAAVAAAILAFAGPLLNPQTERQGDGPLLILLDGTWADARDWPTGSPGRGDPDRGCPAWPPDRDHDPDHPVRGPARFPAARGNRAAPAWPVAAALGTRSRHADRFRCQHAGRLRHLLAVRRSCPRQPRPPACQAAGTRLRHRLPDTAPDDRPDRATL